MSERPHTAVTGADARPYDAGYVMPMTALLLLPLMLFAAFATDVGAWYVRAEQAQRAADAAALAGTVFLPDQLAATDAALDAAARNGFRDPAWVAINGGTANATVTVPGFSTDGGLIVEIETETPSYFGAVVLSSVEIERKSVASVNPPIRMGNPTNGMGTGNLDSSELGTTPDGMWLGFNGWCSDHQNGDPISVEHYGAWFAGGSTFSCGGPYTGLNPTYDPDGYDFIVDVPAGTGGVALEVFEPGLCTDADTSDLLYSANEGSNGGPPLRFRVYANDNTELYHEDNLSTTPVADVTYSTSDCTGGTGAGGRWYTIHTIGSGSSDVGRWYLQANAVPGTSYSNANFFALRARPLTDTQLCSSMTSSSCPELYAKDWLPVWRPSFGGAAIGPVQFFLADISDEYAGKTVEVKLFDAGEGMDNIQFKDPAGDSAAFEFRLANCSVGLICVNNTQWPEETTMTANDSCGSNPCLDVTGARFQDMWAVLEIELPADYSCGADCWWTVEYNPVSGGFVSDRTTWAVRVIGDPVHLTE
ncbi:MAG: pilus assembly protein TadG-related protein [Actinomycetota bacterium]